MAIAFMGILTAVIAVVGYKLYHDSVMESYVSYAETVLEYAYRSSEKYVFGDMIASREMPFSSRNMRSCATVVLSGAPILPSLA